MATDKEQTLNSLRTKILNETMTNEGRDRYGLFSYPPAGASGAGNYNFNNKKNLGSDGKPKTELRGIFGGPTSSGKVESSYFAKTAYVSIGDKYIDPATRDRQYNLEKKKKIKHDAEFRPSDGTKTDPFNSLYKHETEEIHKKKNYRGPNGKVMLQPRNITTNPPKSGHGDSTIGHLLSKGYKHEAEPYNRPKELAAKEREEHKKKLQEAPFRTTSHGNNLFVTTKKTFGKDGQVLPPVKPRATTPPGKAMHDNPFRPSNPPKQGYNKTLAKFPEYKPDPIKVAVRKFADPKDKKDPFKPNDTAFIERPTPSISIKPQNLKNEMARISASLV